MSTAIIFGAGPNIGLGVAQRFISKAYKVVTVSRSESLNADLGPNHKHIRADLAHPESVSDVFATARKAFGEPNLIVHNAFAHIQVSPQNALSPSVDEFAKTLNVNTVSLYAALKEAVSSFEKTKAENKTFIYTGALFNVKTLSPYLLAGAGKNASEYLLKLAQQSNGKKGFKFYYADERTAKGSFVLPPSAKAAADFYEALAERKAGNVPVVATFVENEGYRAFPVQAPVN